MSFTVLCIKLPIKSSKSICCAKPTVTTEDEMKGNVRYNCETVMKCLLLFEFDED